ncbi:MAG: hypothetical protein IH830_00725 [Planctomycetes bacterium]|nr:hypothetical protein [Planctomycetota bacterium]
MPLEELTPQTRAKLEGASAWENPGRLKLTPNWVPLHKAKKSAPALTGLYALGLPRGLRYDKGQTRIVYIGSAKDLCKRLGTHSRTPPNDVIGRLQATFTDKPLATWWAIPALSRKWLLGFEGQSLWAFERTFGTVPIGNLDIPESTVSERCEGLVVFTPCTALDDAPALEEYAKLIGSILVREKKTPIGDPSQITMSLRLSDRGELICGPEEYTAARFYSPEEFDRKRKGESNLPAEDDNPIADIDFVIHEMNVAVWPVEKMKHLIGICSRLAPEERRRQGSVKRFQSSTREVPTPRTWGEVAIVQGRLLAGTWFPSSRTRVKILCGKELLGQAFLFAKSEHGESRIRGEDISDLPQRTGWRPRLWKDEAAEDSQSPRMKNFVAKMNASIERTNAVISNLEERVYEGRSDEHELDLMLKKQRGEVKDWIERLGRLRRIETRQRLATTARLIESLFQNTSEELGRS